MNNYSNYYVFGRWQTTLLMAVVVVKWSAWSPSTPTIRVRIPLKPTVFFCKICV